MATIIQYLKWMRRRDGGVVNTCMQLCPMLASRGHKVCLITCEDDDVPSEGWRKVTVARESDIPALSLIEGTPTCVRVPLADVASIVTRRPALASERDTPTQYLPSLAMRACQHLLRGATVLHLHGIWPPSNQQLAKLAHKQRIPFVVSPHGMLDSWSMGQGSFKKRLFLQLVSSWQLRHAARVHFENEEELRQGRSYCTAPVVAGPPPPIDPQAFAPLPSPQLAMESFAPLREHAALRVLFLGRLNYKKGPDKLIEAAAMWRDAHKAGGPRIITMFAGLGHPPEYEAVLRGLVAKHALQEDVHFLGLVTGAHKWSLLQAVDLVALPTSQENFGIALVEAMLCGTPVITTKQVDTWREFERSGGATILDGGALVAQQLAATVQAMLAAKANFQAAGATAQQWAKATYEPTAMAAAYERMLLE